MSVKLIYEVPQQCPLIQEIGGYCYCRPNVNSKPRGKGKISDNKLTVDFAEYPDVREKGFPMILSIDFGLVPVESSVFREIHVLDSSSTLPFKCLKVRPWKAKTIDRAFKIIQSNSSKLADGVTTLGQFGLEDTENGAGDGKYVGPNRREIIKFRVAFEPELPTMNYSDVFLIWAEDIPIRLECRGLSEGPSVCFSENVLNFGGQYYKDESRLWFKMQNNSGCEAQFQFDTDNLRSTFMICPTSGIIPPFANLTVEVIFHAQKPQTFYKRVFCLLHHQQPQYIDLIGICIPRPFIAPAGPIDFCISTEATQFLPFPTESNEEYFENDWGINFSREVINFGFQNVFDRGGPIGPMTESAVVSITSALPYDVVMEWFQDPLEVFVITPPSCLLPAHQTVLVEIQFQPHSPDTFYTGHLECFVYPTGHMWPESYGPPWEFVRAQKALTNLGQGQGHGITIEIDPGSPVTAGAEEGDMKMTESGTHQRHGKTSSSSDKSRGKEGDSTTETHSPESTLGTTLQVSPSELKIKGKGQKQKKGATKVKGIVSSPTILPSSKGSKKRSATKSDVKVAGSLPILHKSGSNLPIEPLQEEPAADEEPQIGAGIVRSFPLQVTIQHSIGGTKRCLRLEPIQTSADGTAPNSETQMNKEEDKGEQRIEVQAQHNFFIGTVIMTEEKRHSDDSAVKNELHHEGKLVPTGSTLSAHKLSMFGEEGEAWMEEETGSGFFGEEEEGTDFTLATTPQELAIPLCLILTVTGHTFGHHTLIPHYKVPKKITMNPTWPQNRICRSLILKNMNDLPLYFDAGIVERDGVYRVKPQSGVIPGNFHQILLISMNPKLMESCLYVHDCQVEFNLSDKNLISLRGIAEIPTLDVNICYSSNVNESEVVCPETMPGCGSDTFIEFVNTSRFHYKYMLSPLDEEEDISVFTPTPSEGIISPYETVQIKWRFVPPTDEAYYIKWKAQFNVLRARSVHSSETTYYELPITLAGVGRNCFFEAKPDNLEFEMVEIFKEKEMFFTITNRSNAVMTADLRIMHEEWLQWYQAQHIRISPTSVTLAGSESTKISVVVRPDRTNFQKYYIEYAIELTEHEGDQEISEFKKLCDISFIGDHAIFKVTDVMMIARHPIWDAGQCWSMFSLDSLNECLTPSRNAAREGMVPTIPSVYFRFPPAPIDSDPAIVTILLSNNEQLRGFWDLHTLPPKEWAKREFLHKKGDTNKNGVYDGNVKDNKQMLNMIWTRKLAEENMKARKGRAGKTASQDRVGGPPPGMEALPKRKSQYLRAHLYAHKHTPTSTDALKDVEFFKVSPMRGTLQPRESQQISFRYSYKTVGHHRMSVLVRIHPAIFIWLELTGTTVGQNQPYVQLIHKNVMQIHPVCLSDLDPPIQMFWLFNGGNAPSNFEVDPEPFEQIKRNNFGHEVFECLSRTGVVPPRSWAPVLIRFSPLELMEYSIALNIKSENTKKSVTIKGESVLSPAITLHPESHGGINRKHRLVDPLVPVTISPSHVTFTHFVPTGQKATSIVFLTNLSGKNKISFTWPDVPIEGGGSITFVPDSGVIRAKEQATIMVIVKGGRVSTIFSRMIRCSMVDETSLARYELLSKIWNTRSDALARSPIQPKWLSEMPGGRNFNPNEKPAKPSTFSRVLSVKVYIGSVFGLLDTMIPREQARMPFSDTICQPLRKNKLTLLPFGRQLCGELISNMIWDVVNSPSFSSYVKGMSKRRAPFYYEYKSSEMQTKMAKNGKLKGQKEPMVQLPRQASQDILEQVIFNMIQEVAEDFYPGKTNHDIKPVQPQELVDIKKYRRDLM